MTADGLANAVSASLALSLAVAAILSAVTRLDTWLKASEGVDASYSRS